MSLKGLLRPVGKPLAGKKEVIVDFAATEARLMANVAVQGTPETPQEAPKGGTSTYRMDKARLDVRQVRQKIDKMAGQRELLQQQLNEAIMQKVEAEKKIGLYDKVQILLQKTSEYARQQVKRRLEEIVTQALAVVFGKPYRFWMTVETRSNRPEVDYWLECEGVVTQLKPPDYDNGGGIVDVISLALKLAVAELEGVKGPMLLDEVGKHVSAEYAPNVAFFLKEYSRQFNRQIILITHNEALAEIGEVSYLVSQRAGKSVVQAV